MLGPFATASRFTLPLSRCRYSIARRLIIDVHNNDDNDNNNDNA